MGVLYNLKVKKVKERKEVNQKVLTTSRPPRQPIKLPKKIRKNCCQLKFAI